MSYSVVNDLAKAMKALDGKQMRQDSVLLALDRIHESENVARAACTLWASGWGALVSALCICCFLAHRLLYGTLWFVISLLFYIAIPVPEVIQCYHLSCFPIVHKLTDQLTTGGASFCFCSGSCCLLFGVFVGLFVWVFGVCFCLTRWQLNVSIQFSSLLYHIVIMATANVATALIR